jgi:hypothetical protein
MTTYYLNTPQFNAIQFTGSNASAVQSFINTNASGSGILTVTDTSSNTYIMWNGSYVSLPSDGWLVFYRDTLDAQSLPTGLQQAQPVAPPPDGPAPLFYVLSSDGFTATFS